MTLRIRKIFEEIPECGLFADVGCDHGFVTELMLEQKKCERAVVSDISAKSLKKAEKLLKKYIDAGVCTPVVTDGMRGFKHEPDVALIAGMGGEEIIKILDESPVLPAALVLQPMKNTPKLRRKLFESGYGIVRDFVFKDGKYYNLIRATRGAKVQPYSETEYEFGRDNLLEESADFNEYIALELKKCEKYAKGVVSLCDLAYFNNRITLLKEVLNENK